MFCPLYSRFLDLKPIHHLEKKTIRGSSSSMDHGSWERWLQKANMEPSIEWVMGLGMFFQLKSGFLDFKPTNHLEKHDSLPYRLHRSRILGTVDPESQHVTRYRVEDGSGYVLLIVVWLTRPQTNPSPRKTRFLAAAAPWITDPGNCGSRKPTWKQV